MRTDLSAVYLFLIQRVARSNLLLLSWYARISIRFMYKRAMYRAKKLQVTFCSPGELDEFCKTGANFVRHKSKFSRQDIIVAESKNSNFYLN